MTGSPLAGRTCVVTGANSGIGKAAAVALARLGATIIAVCRDRARGDAALADIGAAATGGQPALELADLSSQHQVRALARRLAALDRIDVLINNAGSVNGQRSLTEDGIERTFAVNHLAPFLLTNLLQPALQATAPARVVTVASTAHHGAALDLDDVNAERRYLPMLSYANSKLANILFTRELARRLDGTGVTATALHPGVARTGFASEDPSLMWKLFLPLIRLLLKTPQMGAATSIYLASSPEVEGVTGTYFAARKPKASSQASRDTAAAARLWQISLDLVASTA